MNRRFYIIASATCLLIGAAFYLAVRGYILSPMLPVHTSRGADSFGLLSGSFPSFTHALALMLMSSAFGFGRRNAAHSCMVVGIGFELCQAIFSFGTFDFADVAAVALGVALGAALYIRPKFSQVKLQRIFVYGLYGFGLLTSIATSERPKYKPVTRPMPEPPIADQEAPVYVTHDPVYMTYEDLRQSFAVEKPRPVKEAGKILVVGSTLLINEPNAGVHIFNNADPAKPEAKHFLSIPGNVDLAAKSGIVYADSFIDLVAIRLDGEKPELVHRVEDTFPWNPYQAIKDPTIRFDSEKLDKDRGVVVGSRPKSNGNGR